MVKIKDIVKTNVFDAENVSVKGLVNKDLKILSIALLEGRFGPFVVFKVQVVNDEGRNKLISFASGGVLKHRISNFCKHFGLDFPEHGILDFPEAVETKIVEKKSAKGNKYYDFE